MQMISHSHNHLEHSLHPLTSLSRNSFSEACCFVCVSCCFWIIEYCIVTSIQSRKGLKKGVSIFKDIRGGGGRKPKDVHDSEIDFIGAESDSSTSLQEFMQSPRAEENAPLSSSSLSPDSANSTRITQSLSSSPSLSITGISGPRSSSRPALTSSNALAAASNPLPKKASGVTMTPRPADSDEDTNDNGNIK